MNLSGAFTALYTPFTSDGSVDLEAYEALCRRLIDADMGLVACGTTAETPTLTDEEYNTTVSTAVRIAAGKIPVIAGTGSNCTRKTIALTRHAKELGADIALVVTPYYNKPPQSSLIRHFTEVADHGGLPVMLYNVPGRTSVNMAAETSLALADHPQIVAVKEASGDMGQIQQLALHAPAGFAVFSGDDPLTLPLIQAGGDGVVSVAGNVAPEAIVRLARAALAGEQERARDIQKSLLPLFSALFATTNPIPVKRAAAILGHCGPEVRLPLTAEACTDAMGETLRRALETAGVSG